MVNLELAIQKSAKIQLYHVSGQLVKSYQVDSNTTKQQIDIRDLESGLYFLKIQEDEQHSITKRFIKVD